MDTLANIEEPDEMQHDAAFYQGLPCLLYILNDLTGQKYINSSYLRGIGTNSSHPQKQVTGVMNTYQFFTRLNYKQILHICEELARFCTCVRN